MPYDLTAPRSSTRRRSRRSFAASPSSATAAAAAIGSAPSFDYMLDEAVDTNDGDVAKITSADFRKIVDLCWQCKLCYNHCPYTPPHQWDIDFPRLMLRAKAARVEGRGRDAAGRAGSATSDRDRHPGLGHRAPQQLGQRDRRPSACSSRRRSGSTATRNLPKFHHQTFARWFRQRGGGREPGGPTARRSSSPAR